MSGDAANHLTAVFKLLDLDGSGFIEEREGMMIGKALGYKPFHEYWEELLDLDTDGDGKISLDEFLKGNASMGAVTAVELKQRMETKLSNLAAQASRSAEKRATWEKRALEDAERRAKKAERAAKEPERRAKEAERAAKEPARAAAWAAAVEFSAKYSAGGIGEPLVTQTVTITAPGAVAHAEDWKAMDGDQQPYIGGTWKYATTNMAHEDFLASVEKALDAKPDTATKLRALLQGVDSPLACEVFELNAGYQMGYKKESRTRAIIGD